MPGTLTGALKRGNVRAGLELDRWGHARREQSALAARDFILWQSLNQTKNLYFYKLGNMDTATATLRLAALAQETRLAIFRTLVQSGPEGLNPGVLAERLNTAQATLSFHLKELKHAGLIQARQEGRFIYYSADFDAMNRLLSFLTENCCAESATDCDWPAACGNDVATTKPSPATN